MSSCESGHDAEALPEAGRIDWDLAAPMLARGSGVGNAARVVGCHRTTVWRARCGSEAFRRRIAGLRADYVTEAAAPPDRLREEVVAGIRQKVALGNVRVLLWLADRLGLASPDHLGVAAFGASPLDGSLDVSLNAPIEAGAHKPAPAGDPVPPAGADAAHANTTHAEEPAPPKDPPDPAPPAASPAPPPRGPVPVPAPEERSVPCRTADDPAPVPAPGPDADGDAATAPGPADTPAAGSADAAEAGRLLPDGPAVDGPMADGPMADGPVPGAAAAFVGSAVRRGADSQAPAGVRASGGAGRRDATPPGERPADARRGAAGAGGAGASPMPTLAAALAEVRDVLAAERPGRCAAARRRGPGCGMQRPACTLQTLQTLQMLQQAPAASGTVRMLRRSGTAGRFNPLPRYAAAAPGLREGPPRCAAPHCPPDRAVPSPPATAASGAAAGSVSCPRNPNRRSGPYTPKYLAFG
jgi:hypothetical protein